MQWVGPQVAGLLRNGRLVDWNTVEKPTSLGQSHVLVRRVWVSEARWVCRVTLRIARHIGPLGCLPSGSSFNRPRGVYPAGAE